MAYTYRTLGELRAEMRAMLGGGNLGAAAGLNATLIDTHLRNAQTLLYWTHDWAHLRAYTLPTLGLNQFLIDYPATANPDRIKWISVFRGGVWSKPLARGITPPMYTYQLNYSWPQKWEPYQQIEIWPASDQAYPLRVMFIKALGAFNVDADRASLDDSMVSIVATSTLKAHYRQPDAAIAKSQADTLIIALKGKSWGQSVFNPDDWINSEPLVRPQTV